MKCFYLTISLFFHLRFLLWHFRHLTAVVAFRAPHSLQILTYSLRCWANVFLNGSIIGIFFNPFSFAAKQTEYASKYTFCLPTLNMPEPNALLVFLAVWLRRLAFQPLLRRLFGRLLFCFQLFQPCPLLLHPRVPCVFLEGLIVRL